MKTGQRMPGRKRIARELAHIKKQIQPDFKDEEGNIGIEVRLQVMPTKEPPFFEYRIWDGDPSYDTDHRGFWGNVFVQKDSNCLELAKDLIDQAADHAAQ